jgi:Tfp pilus assembly protein PilP
MKLTTTILAVGMMTGGVWAQSPNVINNVQSTMNTVQQQKTQDSNAALGIAGKSASAQAAKPATAAPAKPAAQTAQAKPVAAKPAATKTAASNAATTKPVATKPAAAPVTQSKAAPATVAAKPAAKSAAKTGAAAPRTVIAAKEPAPKTGAKAAAKPAVPAPVKPGADAKAVATPSADASKAPKPDAKKWAMTGKRDPFFSPVVQQPAGSGCSTGKKCLEIRQINLRGVVKSENGFIAVVTNSLNKAYFLRENDPVFNGYVVKITGDAVVFQETVQDKLGKPLTREVVKRIFTPAV